MDKPISLSVKNFVIRKLSVDMIIPESVIEMVVNYQFMTAIKETSTNKSIEISGFGRFLFNEKKALRTMAKYIDQLKMYREELDDVEITEKKRRNLGMRIDSIEGYIEALKLRIHED